MEERLQYLMRRYADELCSHQEFDELMQLIGDKRNKSFLYNFIESEYSVEKPGEYLPDIDWEYMFNAAVNNNGKRKNTMVHRVHFLRTAWFRNPPSRSTLRWAKYAAAVILIFGIGAYLWNNNLKVKTANSKVVQANSVEKDVAPGSNKAILTLADGTKIILDSTA